MTKLDTHGWKEFVLQDIFEIKTPASRSMKEYSDGTVPYVSSGSYNNGICGYLAPQNNEKLESGNCITISPLDASAFYQKEDFLGRGGAGSAISMLYNENLNKYNALFICSIIKKAAYKFNYSDSLNGKNLRTLSIKLPISPNGAIDWTYMEEYMKAIEKKTCDRISRLEAVKKSQSTAIDVHEWGKFHLYDIFEISMGNKFDRSKMQQVNPSINFVGRSGIDNGVACKVDLVKDVSGEVIKPYNAGDMTIAMGGSIGAAFVQENDFYTSQNVCVLHTTNSQITFWAKQFIATAITTSCNNYEAFVDELNRHIKTDFTIYLPVISDGSPDYEYMDKYMRKVHGGGTQVLQALTDAMM